MLASRVSRENEVNRPSPIDPNDDLFVLFEVKRSEVQAGRTRYVPSIAKMEASGTGIVGGQGLLDLGPGFLSSGKKYPVRVRYSGW